MEDILIPILAISFAFLIIYLLFIYLPMKMARKRGRSVFGWILIFWILNPLWGAILLLILGDSQQKVKEDIIKELNQNQ
ncbi:MAG: hypothetical protein IKB14_06060 [Rikenellaceae bacterium]|nr:hypothetical protein [Rikenellaceae bacterium]MBR2420262.1 hypothetical protein [Rikenellaceae bacterium]MBR3801036.1 hypothetical protein [Rikenellaceae bacterium]